MKPREERVVRLRCGLDESGGESREEVAARLALTRERIPQIESDALARLRHPSRAEQLLAFL
jgi:RNA polymerase primary sigma factor